MKAGWTQTTLGAVCKLQSGAGFPVKYQGKEAGQFPFFKVSDMNLEGNEEELVIANNYISDEVRSSLGARIFPSGSVVFPKVGGAIATNKKRRTAQPSCVDNNVMGLIPKVELIDPEYLFKWIYGFDIYEFSNKANPPSITQASVSSWPIWLPPLGEQKRIVAILDQAFDALDRARAHVEANLADALTVRSQVIENELSNVQLGQLEALGSYVELLTGFAFKSAGYSDNPSDIRLVRGDNILQGKFRWAGVKRWPTGERDSYAKYELALDDILIAMDRTWVSAGIKYTIVDEEALPSLLVQRVARLRAKESALPCYLGYWIGSNIFEKYVLSIQTGLGVPHVSGKQIESFKIRVPSVEAQRALTQKLDLISERCAQAAAAYEKQLADITALRQSLLQQAFSGQLT